MTTPIEQKEEKQYVNVAEMFAGVQPSFKELLLSAKPELVSALEKIDPRNISPRVGDILEFARYVPVRDIRVCIIGQDPYPDVNHAHGLCFSTCAPVLPASLRNIYACLQLHGHIPKGKPFPSGYLASWASAGVLMINMALTTQPGKPDAHKDIWHPYMKKILAAVGALDQHIVYLLWGKYAQGVAPLLINNGKAKILKETHPSPMSQAKLAELEKFQHCDHFDEANNYLMKHSCGLVDWDPSTAHVAYISCGHFETVNESLKSAGLGVIDWDPDATHIAYTDGSATGNGQGAVARGGYAAYFTSGPLKSLKLTGRISPVHSPEADSFIFPSNIRGEGFAIIHVLEHVAKCRATKIIEVVTDSKFWIEMVEKFIPSWVKKEGADTTFATHKNPDLVARLWDVIGRIKAAGGKVTFRHVYSHGKDASISPIDKKYNAIVDLWASAARNAEHMDDVVGRG
jgi:uracil-DNA glycosylase